MTTKLIKKQKYPTFIMVFNTLNNKNHAEGSAEANVIEMYLNELEERLNDPAMDSYIRSRLIWA